MTRNVRSDLSLGLQASQPPRAEVQSTAASGLLLPLGAMLLAGSINAGAQTVPAASEATLSTVTVKEQGDPVELKAKNSLRATSTQIGKGKQELRDIPQSVTVMTERLMDDRNLDDFREVLKTTAGVTFMAGETGEEDVRLRGFSPAKPARRTCACAASRSARLATSTSTACATRR